MDAPRTTPSPAAVVDEVSWLSAGLGIFSFALFPLAMPLVLVFVVAPLAILAAPFLLLAAVVVVPFKLVRMVARRVRRRAATSAGRSGSGSPWPVTG